MIEMTLPFLCTFQTVIVYFLISHFKTVVGVTRKKGCLDTVRQPKYWSGQLNEHV
jgi:hypothetical protein